MVIIITIGITIKPEVQLADVYKCKSQHFRLDSLHFYDLIFKAPVRIQ